MSENKIPNPGSDEARQRGCRCPVLDNNHGRGWGKDEHGNDIFVYNMECPLHGINAPRSEDD